MQQALGMIQVKSNEELVAEETAQREAEARQQRPEILTLVSYAHKCWEAAKYAKQPIDARMLRALRMRNGEHEPDKLVKIREFGGSEIYMMIPDEKCTSLEAWLEDILFMPGQEPWTTAPTPEPEVSPAQKMEIAQQVRAEAAKVLMAGMTVTRDEIAARLQELAAEAQDRLGEQARKAEAKVETHLADVLTEAKWKNALKDAIPDLATHPAAFIKGPVYRKKPMLSWGADGQPVVKDQIQREFEWVSAFDIYPSPNATGIDDGWLFERYRLTRAYLYSLIDVKGFDSDAIRLVLQDHGMGGLRDWLAISGDSERRRLENRDKELWDPDSRIDALRFWCSVQGLMLLQAGMDPSKIEDPLAEYDAEIWLIGNYVIKAEINGDPLKRKPYYKAAFRPVPGSFWGKSPCDVITDKVDTCNAAARSLVNNMALASGPQVGVDSSMNPGGHDYSKFHPWKVWQFDMSESQSARPPIWFFQPNALINELMAVYDKFSQEIDTILGLPKMAGGVNERGGMAGTATGASMLQTNMTKTIKRVVGSIDSGWIEPSVQRMFQDLMIYEPTPEMLAGDIRLVASGASSMIAKEQQQVRRNEFFQLLMNPVLLNLLGPVPIVETLRSIAQGVDIDLSNLIPTKEELLRQSQNDAAMVQGQLPPGAGPAVNGAGDVAGGADVRTF